MNHFEEVKNLRSVSIDGPHANCAQTLLIAFADEIGVSKEQASKLGSFFGGGMMHGSTCGALSAAFMILGMKGYDKQEASKLLRDFREKHQSTECVDLLKIAKDEGIEKKQHCDGLIFEMTQFLDETLSLES